MSQSHPSRDCAFSTARGGGSGDMGALAPGVVAAGVPGVPDGH